MTSTYTEVDSKPLCLFDNILLTIVSQTKLEEGLTIPILSPIVNSNNCFLFLFLFLFLFFEILMQNLSDISL
jgi:hypothetical protein